MGLHIAAVDRDRAANPALIDQGLVDPLPDPPPGPAIKTVVDRRIGAVFARAVAPTAARSQDMKDAADDASIVDPARTRLIVRQQGFDDRPSRLVEPKRIAHDLSDPNRYRSLLESQLHLLFNTLIRYGP